MAADSDGRRAIGLDLYGLAQQRPGTCNRISPMTTSILRRRVAVPPPRPFMWFFVVGCSVLYAVANMIPQIQQVIRQFPDTGWWGLDADLVFQASRRWLDGQSAYADPSFVYTPLAVLLGAPATHVPREYVLLAYALFKVILAAIVTLWLSRGSWLAVLGVLTFLPLINDVAPGNFMVPITAAMALATFGQERRRSGVPLGLIAAAIPKPLLAPYFVWLLFRRRKSAEGAFIAAAVVTGAAAVVAGPGMYLDWLHNLAQGNRFIWAWPGNSGVSAYLPDLAVPIAILVMALSVIVVLRAHENRSLAWVLAAGILVAPYAGPLAALPLLLTLPILRPWPRLYAILLLQPVATLTVALAGLLAMCLAPPCAIVDGEVGTAKARGSPALAVLGPEASPRP